MLRFFQIVALGFNRSIRGGGDFLHHHILLTAFWLGSAIVGALVISAIFDGVNAFRLKRQEERQWRGR